MLGRGGLQIFINDECVDHRENKVTDGEQAQEGRHKIDPVNFNDERDHLPGENSTGNHNDAGCIVPGKDVVNDGRDAVLLAVKFADLI